MNEYDLSNEEFARKNGANIRITVMCNRTQKTYSYATDIINYVNTVCEIEALGKKIYKDIEKDITYMKSKYVIEQHFTGEFKVVSIPVEGYQSVYYIGSKSMCEAWIKFKTEGLL